MKTINTNTKQTLIDRKELAARWGCSILTVKRREKDGILKPIHLSTRLVRYRLADVEELEALATA